MDEPDCTVTLSPTSTQSQMDEDNSYDVGERYQEASIRKRYDIKRPSLKDLQAGQRAKNIWVYTNGQAHLQDAPVKVTFSRRTCRTLESLLDEISRLKARTSKVKVEYLYKWPCGTLVTSLAEVLDEDQNVFVSSDKSTRLFTKGQYACMDYTGSGGAGGNRSSRESRDTYRSQKPSPTSVRSHGSSMRPVNSRPVNITVISNTHRKSKQSVFVNLERPFEDLLNNITDMLQMDTPCKALHPVKYPHEKADSTSSFKRIIQSKPGIEEFFAVGSEKEVYLQSPRDTSPRRNGYSKQQQKPKNGIRQNGYQDDHMTNGYDRQQDEYEDTEGRSYRRHQANDERNQPDGDDNDDMYTPRNDRNDRNDKRRYDSPERHQPKQSSQRINDYRNNKRREESNDRNDKNRRESNARGPYDSHDKRRDASNDRGRNGVDNRRDDTRRDDGKRENRGRDDGSRNDKGRSDRGRNEKDRDVKGNSNRESDSRRNSYRRRDASDDEDDDDKGRGNSPTESEMNDRINDVDEVRSDLDKDIDY